MGWLRVKPLMYIGRISYSMYLVHLGILILIMPRIAGIAGDALALVITIVYASLSWHIMESRLLGRRLRVGRPLAESA